MYRGPKDLRVAKVPFVWTFSRFFVGLVWACLVLLILFVCVAFCVWFCYCIVCLFVCLFDFWGVVSLCIIIYNVVFCMPRCVLV